MTTSLSPCFHFFLEKPCPVWNLHNQVRKNGHTAINSFKKDRVVGIACHLAPTSISHTIWLEWMNEFFLKSTNPLKKSGKGQKMQENHRPTETERVQAFRKGQEVLSTWPQATVTPQLPTPLIQHRLLGQSMPKLRWHIPRSPCTCLTFKLTATDLFKMLSWVKGSA